MTYLIEVPAEVKFKKWYSNAIEILGKLNHGDGGIAALMVALPLYERYLTDVTGGDVHKRASVIKDELGFADDLQARIFWNVFRDGLCHMGTFWEESDKSVEKGWVLPKVGLDDKHPPIPTFTKDSDGKDVIIVNPWKFVEFILGKYSSNPNLLHSATAQLLPLYFVVEYKAQG